MSAGKCARHMMGCASLGSGDVAATLGYGWGVRGTAVGPRSTAPSTHIIRDVVIDVHSSMERHGLMQSFGTSTQVLRKPLEVCKILVESTS